MRAAFSTILAEACARQPPSCVRDHNRWRRKAALTYRSASKGLHG